LLAATAYTLLLLCTHAKADPSPYPWLTAFDAEHALERRIAPPPGFVRAPAAPGTFAAWLRGLPLRPGRPPVRLHDGRLKGNQEAHHAVVDVDTGRRNLQQCADAVMRLRAEYLFASGQADAIAFNFTSGDRAAFSAWAKGDRPLVRGNRVSWRRSAPAARSHESLRAYLDSVFTYAGSASLARELTPVAHPRDVEIGDVFIEGGSPGHAVLVVDVARHADGRAVFLLAQSYMPAQDVHVLRNPAESHPWYSTSFGDTLRTPEWTFRPSHLRRF
jgi:hypothetical protein